MRPIYFTPCEIRVAELLLQAASTADMRQAMKVSRSSIQHHLMRMFLKLDVGSFGIPRVRLALVIHDQRKQLGVRCQACGEM